MKIAYLSDNWPWFGRYSSYSRLIHYIKKLSDVDVVETKYTLPRKVMGKIYSTVQGVGRKDSVFAASEFLFRKKINRGLAHVLYYDTHYPMWKKELKNVVTTIHHPPDRMLPALMKMNLRNVSKAIVLSRKNIEFYKEAVGENNVVFIPHGVDTEFFSPAETCDEQRMLFVGQNGRNTVMFSKVVKKLLRHNPDLIFDLLVVKDKRTVSGLKELRHLPNVNWLSTKSSEELRDIYQRSYLLVMPMESCSANNAIVESLACGLPVVTTDVGGIRDYGGGTVYKTADNVQETVELVEKYLEDRSFRDKIAKDCRYFAVEILDWKKIAILHMDFYIQMAYEK